VLPRSFYARGAEEVARDLLGATLCVRRREGTARVRVVETEAYVGPHDLACHAARGRTRRTEVMFGPAGHAYVYLIYGMYDMLNVVTGTEGDPQAVLVRAAEPDDARASVQGPPAQGGPVQDGPPPGSARTRPTMHGPGRLARALGITVGRHNGADLCARDAARDALWFESGRAPAEVAVTPRIGVGYAGAWADAPLRFCDARSGHVSPAPTAKASRSARR